MIWYITNVDTEILALRVAVDSLPPEFPKVRAAQTWTFDLDRDLPGAQCVIVRLLRGRRAWEGEFDRLQSTCLGRGIPLLAFAGEAVPDAELTALSSVPSAILTDAFAYLVNGGPENFEHLLRFVADTVLFEGFGFEPPVAIPSQGVWRISTRHGDRPVIGVVFYRAHLVAGNTQFVTDGSGPLILATIDRRASPRHVITEVGPDDDAIRSEDRDGILFDLGLGREAASFCVRAVGDTVDVLRAERGSNWRDVHERLAPMLIERTPHRVVIAGGSRTEISSVIPAPGTTSPPGSHTHLQPGELELGRDLPPGLALPTGFQPAAIFFPPTGWMIATL